MTEEGHADFDAEYLMKLARQKSAESRTRLSQIVIDLFDESTGVLSDHQRALMYGILQSRCRPH